jgi:hypothetical protein
MTSQAIRDQVAKAEPGYRFYALYVSFGVGSERRSARQLVDSSEKGGVKL